MEASLHQRAEQLAKEMAGEAATIEDLNDLMRQIMKAALERMLDTEMDVHLGRRPPPGATGEFAKEVTAAADRPSKKRSTKNPPNRRNGRSRSAGSASKSCSQPSRMARPSACPFSASSA